MLGYDFLDIPKILLCWIWRRYSSSAWREVWGAEGPGEDREGVQEAEEGAGHVEGGAGAAGGCQGEKQNREDTKN